MTRLAVMIFVLGAALGFGFAARAASVASSTKASPSKPTIPSVAAADEKAQEFVVCKSSKSVRTLSITPDSKAATPSCKVTYTKAGVAETVGEHSTNSSCHSILDHVREHLENSKWNCKEVSATVTTSGEVLRQ